MTVEVVISDAESAAPLVRWGARLARARGEGLSVLYVARGAKAGEVESLPLQDAADAHPVRLAIRGAIREACAMLLDDEGDGGLGQGARIEAQARRAQSARDSQQVPRPAPASGQVQTPLAAKDGAKRGGQDAAQDASDSAAGSECELAPPVPQLPASYAEFVSLRSVAHPDALAAVLREVRAAGPSLLVVGRQERLSNAGLENDLAGLLMEQAPCDAILIRASGTSGQRCAKVLIPASGGPHAPVALGLAKGLAQGGADVQPLYVEQVGGDDKDSREIGMRCLHKVLRDANLDPADPLIHPRVEIGDNPARAIGTVAHEGYDLVLVGASNRGFMRRILFGAVPEHLLAGETSIALAVVRRGTPLQARLGAWVSERIARYLPRLSREDRLALFTRLESGSRFDVDFLALISLSTGIASLGLLQNSPAVVIGAMLVAPLMTPMVGAGLALVQDNVVLAKEAARSILFGFLTALLIGVFIGEFFGWVLPGGRLSSELLARGGPNALDLGVALLSGLAAAYAIGRPSLSGALPGVAIAAALVPPIGTAGISLATGHHANARGAALLFGTNLVAIVLGAAITFLLVGVRPGGKQVKRRHWVRRIVIGLVLVLGVLAIPLGLGLLEVVSKPNSVVQVTELLKREIEVRVEADPDATLVSIGHNHSRDRVEILIASASEPTPALVRDLAQIVARRFNHPVPIHVVTLRHGWTQIETAPVTSGD